jgi:hypothetical protein
VDKHRHEVAHSRRRELNERLLHVALDRLAREDASKLDDEALDSAFEMPARDGVEHRAHGRESFGVERTGGYSNGRDSVSGS